MKFTFICEHEADLFGPKTTNTLVIDGEQTVSQLLERFEDYLRGCGYVIDGHLEVAESFNECSDYEFNRSSYMETIERYSDSEFSFSVADDILRTQDC